MFPNDNAFLTEQYKTYRLQLVQLTDGDISDFRLNKYKVHLLFLTQMEVHFHGLWLLQRLLLQS